MKEKIAGIIKKISNITDSDIEKALDIQRLEGYKRRIGEILIESVISREDFLKALSLQFDIPVINEEDIPSGIVLENISFNFLKTNKILPVRLAGNVLDIAVADPTDSSGVDAIRASYGYEIRLFLVSGEILERKLDEMYESHGAVMQRIFDDVEKDGIREDESTGELDHLRDLAQDKGIVQLVHVIIENAVRDRASDVHVEPEEKGVKVRYRIDGILYERERLPARMRPAITSRIKLLAQMNIAERRLPQDGRIKGRYSDKEIDIRVSTLPTVYGESIVMRLLDKESAFISLEGIGFDDELLSVYRDLIMKPYGMILLTGPTGSGKTTTLYASLEKIKSSENKIIAIEEPVEYLMNGINQINVRPKIGLTFANGLRHIVRQDPDIIMVGEIRDLETANIAIHAALTGHLLFSTLHTNDAPGAIARLMDMGVENYLVSSTLVGVMAQRLVRKICPKCKKPYDVEKDVGDGMGLTGMTVYRGAGCGYCSNTGYRGRVGIFEILPVNDAMRDMIMKDMTVLELKEKAVSLGMRTLRQDGVEKIRKGLTTVDEVLRVTQIGL
ncbi:type II secretion system protein E [bacterium BMS3Bbin05]|nr:type II secretion system protein E [bacterium BMS3Bbin05]